MPSSPIAETTRLRKSTDKGPISRRLRIGAAQESDFLRFGNPERFNPRGNRSSLEPSLGTNKEDLALREALYWMAEKLTWGYEDVEPDPVEALNSPLMKSRFFSFASGLWRG